MNEVNPPRRQFTISAILLVTVISSLSLVLINGSEQLGGWRYTSGGPNVGNAVGFLGFLIAAGLVGWIVGFAIKGTHEAASVGAAILVFIVILIFLAEFQRFY